MKKVAIIGAGFSGLAAAWECLKKGYEVEVFEAGSLPGGLASGLQEKEWDWSLEHHYHHIFETDRDIQSLLQEMGLEKKLFFQSVHTRSYYKGKGWSLDSPISLLRFSPLSFFDRLRVGIVLAFLKLVPNGRFLEKYTAHDFLSKMMGNQGWEILWKPLFVGKFGQYSKKINMAWFWARIAARSQKLGYYTGGFLRLAQDMVSVLEKKSVQFSFSQPVVKIEKNFSKIQLIFEKNKKKEFDAVLVTLPSPLLEKILPSEKHPRLAGLGARTLLLELDKEFFDDGTYWLSIHEKNWPFLAVVEHTNLAQKKNYGNTTLVYVGKYLSPSDLFFSLSPEKALAKYLPYLEKLSPGFSQHILRYRFFNAPFAQPLVFQNHSELLPHEVTSIPGVFWTSMQHVYPWDRGINYAIRFGKKVFPQIQNYLNSEEKI